MRRSGPIAENLLRDVGPVAAKDRLMSHEPGRQVLSDRHLHGRQPPARAGAAHRPGHIERNNSLNSGHRACQGCGEALGARYAIDAAMRATGNQLIAANATGCLEVFSTPYPEILVAAALDPFAVRQRRRGGHRHRRGAQGQGAQGRARRAACASIAQGGDGGTTDIGFGCLSGMFERNDDVLYICYDNEAYMNTGVQRSSATPPGSAHRDDDGRRARSRAPTSARARTCR